jgi:hypothetical protein
MLACTANCDEQLLPAEGGRRHLATLGLKVSSEEDLQRTWKRVREILQEEGLVHYGFARWDVRIFMGIFCSLPPFSGVSTGTSTSTQPTPHNLLVLHLPWLVSCYNIQRQARHERLDTACAGRHGAVGQAELEAAT